MEYLPDIIAARLALLLKENVAYNRSVAMGKSLITLFFENEKAKYWVFQIILGSTPGPICMQIFKSPGLQEVP